jgi:hypothetical protein
MQNSFTKTNRFLFVILLFVGIAAISCNNNTEEPKEKAPDTATTQQAPPPPPADTTKMDTASTRPVKTTN